MPRRIQGEQIGRLTGASSTKGTRGMCLERSCFVVLALPYLSTLVQQRQAQLGAPQLRGHLID